MAKLEQITDARHPLSQIKTTRGDIAWGTWLAEEAVRLRAGSYYEKGTVSAQSHGNGTLALWGVPSKGGAS